MRPIFSERVFGHLKAIYYFFIRPLLIQARWHTPLIASTQKAKTSGSVNPRAVWFTEQVQV